MIEEAALRALLPQRFAGVDLPFLGAPIPGKVRDNYRTDDGRRVLVASDRLSAFDRILGLVPLKGQLLTQLAAWWFAQTEALLPNHLLELPDPNVTVARECVPLPVEIIVRGYISGVTSTALWTRYAAGERHIYGLSFPEGLRKNDPLPEPILTPTTKAAAGGHDERITEREIVARGLVSAARWDEARAAALALFQRGQALAAAGGLLLVDTKYEFGVDATGTLRVIDEMHTPDSSRFWLAESYEARRSAGEEPDNVDKEFVRLRYAALGYRGEGEPPRLPDELAVAAAQRYITCYERLTGAPFVPAPQPTAPRVAAALATWHAAQR